MYKLPMGGSFSGYVCHWYKNSYGWKCNLPTLQFGHWFVDHGGLQDLIETVLCLELGVSGNIGHPAFNSWE